MPYEGILPLDKPKGITSFQLVKRLRASLGVQKIGHAGTLDPFATGVMVMLIGRPFTRLSDQFLNAEKEYFGRVHLGVATDTHDCEGNRVLTSAHIPTPDELQSKAAAFQGEIHQTPPMFSAKKIKGVKLYQLARKGKTIERSPVTVHISLKILDYSYPFVDIHVRCSKGTYIRTLAHDLGLKLNCGAHLSSLRRTRSGNFSINDCYQGELQDLPAQISQYLCQSAI